LLNPTSIAYSLGARLADVLFDGGLSEARIEAVSATHQQALANNGRAALDAYFDVESTLNTRNILDERRIFVQQSADAARKIL